ncbi:TniQ family protein [Salipiger mucosus]|uniref:TniQ domain-containing protein n=1 Tax=Salipiger mucosus DSM 16094 TaxID=1123237 RepID=S9Q9V3_9RHOB|nr:TniQ family protein [Salipiger mucosus]EPX76418.1 hypothetical protein Salmuc_00304 [Salipiger mucosus DSM 16094]
MAKLYPHLPFCDDETPISWAGRLAAFHTSGGLVPFLNDIGVPAVDLARGVDTAVDRLCDVADQDSAPVRHNVIKSLGGHLYVLRGQEFSAEFRVAPSTRFCPMCLAEDEADPGAPHAQRRHRVSWALAAVSTCERHGIALLDRRTGRWDDTLGELRQQVPEDRDSLLSLARSCESRSVSPMQTYILGRIAGQAGPDWLDAQDIEQGWRASAFLGGVLAFGPDKRAGEMSPEDWELAQHAGWSAVAEGRQGIDSALDSLLVQARTSGSRGYRPQGALGMLYRWLSWHKMAKDPGAIRALVRDKIRDGFPLKAGQTLMGEPVEAPRLSSVAAIAKTEHVDPRTLQNMLVSRAVVPASEKDHWAGDVVLDYQQGVEVAAAMKRAVSVSALPDRLNASRPMVRAVIRLGYLRLLGDVELAGSKLSRAVDRIDVEKFEARLQELGEEIDECPRGMVPLAKAAEKTRQKIGVILPALFDGRLKRVCRMSDIPGIDGVVIDTLELKSVLSGCRPGMTVELALAMLGIGKNATKNLINNREGGPLLDTIETDDGTWVTPEAMGRFRKRFAVKTRLPLETGLKKYRVEQILARHGVEPVFDPKPFGVALYFRKDLPVAWEV